MPEIGKSGPAKIAIALMQTGGDVRNLPRECIDIPPHDAEEPEPSFIVVYTKTGTPRVVVLSSIDHIEVEPLTRS